MFSAPVRLFRSAYGGLPREMWWQALVMLVNRSGTMVLPFLTVYIRHLGYSLEQAGWVMTAFGAGAIAGGYLGGYLTDRIGFLRVQFLSLFLSGLFFFFLSFIRSLEHILLFTFVVSIIGEAYRPANAAAIAAYSNETNRTRSYTLNRLAINLGWSVGPALGGLLAGISYNWLFWADGGTCIFAALLLWTVQKPSRPRKVQKGGAELPTPARSPIRDRIFLRGMLCLLLVLLAFFQLFTIVPVYYKEEVRLTSGMIGGVLALNGLVIALVEMLLVYHLEKKNRGLQYMKAGALCVGAAFLLLLVREHLLLVVLSMLVITVGEMLLFPFINNFWVARSTEANRGQYAAFFTMTFALAHVLAPTFASQIAGRYGFGALWASNFCVCLLAAAGFVFLKKRSEQHEGISTLGTDSVV